MNDSGFDVAGTLDEQARSLRNCVFEIPTTDNNWSHCKDNWMRPDTLKWLKEQMEILRVRAFKEKPVYYVSKYG